MPAARTMGTTEAANVLGTEPFLVLDLIQWGVLSGRLSAGEWRVLDIEAQALLDTTPDRNWWRLLDEARDALGAVPAINPDLIRQAKARLAGLDPPSLAFSERQAAPVPRHSAEPAPACDRDVPVPFSLDARQAVLQREIAPWLSRGYRVVSQTVTTTQLVKPRRMSPVLAVALAIVTIPWYCVGLLVYWLYARTKREPQVYLDVEERGRVHSARK